jgi:uncharacterized protein (DUF2236 family)
MASGRAHPVLGFYGPETMMWHINREAVLLGCGPAALLLQIAHPSVARGVAEHSNFLGDPWSRLHGTINTTLALVFGDGPAAERAVRKLNRVHAGVRGEGYRALDPELLLWVQATLIVTSVEAYQRWVGPLEPAEKEQFWQEARRVGVRLGIGLDLSPVDWPALHAYWSWMLSPDGPIKVSDVARRLAPSIVRPPFPLVPGVAIDLLTLPGFTLLPPRIREEFGIPWDDQRERLAGLLGLMVKGWTHVIPAQLRSMPQAVAAFRRAGAYRSSGGNGAAIVRPPSTRSTEPVTYEASGPSR